LPAASVAARMPAFVPHVAGEQCVFGLDDLWAARVADGGDLRHRNLLATHPGHENPAQRFDVVVQLAEVPHADGIALEPLNRGGDAVGSLDRLQQFLWRGEQVGAVCTCRSCSRPS